MIESDGLRTRIVRLISPTPWRFGALEGIAAILLFLTLFVTAIEYKIIRTDEMRGDSAMYLQGTQSLASRGVPLSQVQGSIVDYLNRNTYMTMPADELAKTSIFATPAEPAEVSILLGHAYFILYPIAAAAKIFPVRTVLMTLYALSFTGMVALGYFALRRRQIPVAAACLFCMLVVTHPVWWQGLIWGQFYPDRLFLLAGLAFMLGVVRESPEAGGKAHRAVVLCLAVLCAAINERGAIVAGLFLLLYVGLYWKRPGLDRPFNLVLGAILFCYGLAALKLLVPSDVSYSTFLPTSPSGLLATMQAPRFLPLITLFVLANAPLFILALFEWRAAAIAAVLMLPNVFGNIGGAEKVGWVTHYPSFFFAPLVWAALNGYAKLYGIAIVKRLPAAAYALPVVLLLYLAMLNPTAVDPVSFSISNLRTSALPTFNEQVQEYLLQSGVRESLQSAVEGIAGAVPPGARVSSVEAGMPLLYQDRNLQFFPKDIDHADYAVLGAAVTDGKILYNGAVTSLGAAELQKIDAAVVARMRRDGYDLAHPKLFPAFAGLAVVRRVH